MGWGSGSELAQYLWDDMKEVLTDEQKKKFKKSIVKRFEEMDCDTLDDCEFN